MFGLGPGELLLIIIAGFVIFGPERLPKVAQDAGRVLRQMRRMAEDVRTDLSEELGPELADLDLHSLNPRALVHKHLLDPSLDEVKDAGPVGSAETVPASSIGAGGPSLIKQTPPAPPPAATAAVATGATVPAHATPFDSDAT